MPVGTEDSVGFCLKQSWRTSLTSVATSTEGDLEGVGSVRIDQYGKRYRWIQNEGDTASRVGAPACFDAGNAGASNFLEAVPVEDIVDGDVEYFAGVWMAAVAAGGYGWIQTYGMYDPIRLALVAAGSAAIGDHFVPSTYTVITETGTTAAYCFVIGQVAEVVLSTSNAVTLAEATNPDVVAVETVTSAGGSATGTGGVDAAVFIRGFMQ